MTIYVEILIHSDMQKVWEFTQNPALHSKWDLRFTSIEYLPRCAPSDPQLFLYTTKIGFGLNICGNGETRGNKEDNDKNYSSALKFWSEHPLSLIKEGSGYWQYVPADEGVLFRTEYNYKTRFGYVGKCFDQLIFRRLLGWATAWSFDRLRLWLESGIDPSGAIERTVILSSIRLILSLIWVYEGIVPKILFPDSGETSILNHFAFITNYAREILILVGIGEILIGINLLITTKIESRLKFNIILLLILVISAGFSDPKLLVAPFNPVTLNSAMIALALIGLFVSHDLPDALRCSRTKSKK